MQQFSYIFLKKKYFQVFWLQQNFFTTDPKNIAHFEIRTKNFTFDSAATNISKVKHSLSSRDCVKKNITGLMRHYAKTINNMKSSYTLFLYRHIVGNFPQKIFFHIYNGFWYFDQYTFSLLLHIQPFLHDFFSAKKIVN